MESTKTFVEHPSGKLAVTVHESFSDFHKMPDAVRLWNLHDRRF